MSERPIYPEACVARLPKGTTDKTSATLVARRMGLLSVQIFFHRAPVPDLEVQFAKARDDGAAGDAVGELQRTNARGVAALDFLVPVGHYVCQIERQDPTVVATVHELDEAAVLVLPIGRPDFDAGDHEEFDQELTPLRVAPSTPEEETGE